MFYTINNYKYRHIHTHVYHNLKVQYVFVKDSNLIQHSTAQHSTSQRLENWAPWSHLGFLFTPGSRKCLPLYHCINNLTRRGSGKAVCCTVRGASCVCICVCVFLLVVLLSRMNMYLSWIIEVSISLVDHLQIVHLIWERIYILREFVSRLISASITKKHVPL